MTGQGYSYEGLTLGTSALKLLKRWSIYVINSTDDTKLPCYTLSPTQHNSSFKNLPPQLQVTTDYVIIIIRFILVIIETQAEAAKGNENFPYNNSSGEKLIVDQFFCNCHNTRARIGRVCQQTG